MKKIFLIIVVASVFMINDIQAQVERKVIVEHYTNTKCGICGARNPAFYALMENYPEAIHIAYHPSSPYSTCFFSQQNPSENDARTNYYGIYGGTPRVVVSGDVIPPSGQLLTSNQMDAATGLMSDFEIIPKLEYVNDNTINVNVIVNRVNSNGDENLNVYVMLAEDYVEYNAPNGEDLHHDVFRKELMSNTVDLGVNGSSIELNKQYSPEESWNADLMYAIVILQDETTKEVVQTAKTLLAQDLDVLSVTDEVAKQSYIYPNPVKEQLRISNEAKNFEFYRIYNMAGQLISSGETFGVISTSEFESGIYMIQLIDNENNSITKKFHKL